MADLVFLCNFKTKMLTSFNSNEQKLVWHENSSILGILSSHLEPEQIGQIISLGSKLPL